MSFVGPAQRCDQPAVFGEVVGLRADELFQLDDGAVGLLDVAGANRDQLLLAGVPDEQILMSGLCTAMHLDVLTSYRAEKEKAGRIAGVIARG